MSIDFSGDRVHKRPTSFDDAARARFLAHLAQGYSVTASAKVAGVSVRTVWRHKEHDPAFAREWDEHYEQGTDMLEDAMLAKALQPQGFLANMASLKARRPGKWRDDRLQASLPAINITLVGPSAQELRTIIDTDYRLLPNVPQLEGTD